MKEKKNSSDISGLRVVAISSLVSLGDVVFSMIVAAITGSSVMFAQGLQGLADLITTIFLFFGIKRSSRPATKRHPLGYGRELFFWVLISSLFAFLMSGGVASYRAIQQLMDGNELENISIALAALSLGLFTNSYSLNVSLKRLQQKAGRRSLWKYLRHSSVVETKMTLLVDLMGTLSASLGLVALVLYQITGNAVFDSAGALLIGLLTAAGALFVIIDLRDLIVGRSPSPTTIRRIRSAAKSVKGVQEILDMRAVNVGSGDVQVILELHFDDGLSVEEVEKITDSVKESVKKKEPQVTSVHVEAETPDDEL